MNKRSSRLMKALALFFPVVCSLFVSAQQEGLNMQKNWYFGTYAISFESGTAVEKMDNPNFLDPASCISDPLTGKLVLYSNGKTAWNGKHREIKNGSLLLPPDLLICNNVLIAPDPAGASKYYVFVTGYPNNLYVAQIDMSLNNGDGEVTSASRELYKDVNPNIGLVRYKRDNGWWLVAHGLNDNSYLAFLIHNNGIRSVPVISKTGYTAPSIARSMAISPKGDKVAMSLYNGTYNIQIISFDKECGRFSHPGLIEDIGPNSAFAFSPNGSGLYAISSLGEPSFDRTVHRYTDFREDNTPASVILVDSGWGGEKIHESIAPGPDGKMYILTFHRYQVGYHTLAVIPRPDESNCGFEDEAIRLKQVAAYNQFPTMVSDITPASQLQRKIEIGAGSYCLGKPTTFKSEYTTSYDSIRWKIDDNNGHEYTNNARQFDLSLPGKGAYTIKLIGYDCVWNDTLIKTIRVDSIVKPFLGADTTICKEASLILLPGVTAEKYRWSDESAQQSMMVTEPGTYWVEVSNGDCKSGDTIEVKKYPELWTALGDEYFICEDDRELVKLDAGEGFQQYRWTPTGDSTQWIIVKTTGDYFVVVKDFRGCVGDDGTKVKRRCTVRLYFPDAFTPNADGLNDVFKPEGQDITDFHLLIFNRWGGQVFSSDDFHTGWNGIANGRYAPEGTYVYTCTYKGFEGKRVVEKSTRGRFTLLR